MATENGHTMNGEAVPTFYSATAVAHKSHPRLMHEIDTHFCVIGGGFAGLWTARALARRGYDVVLLEAGRIAGEASGRNGGVVSAGFAERLPRIVDRVGLDHAKALYRLSREGVEIVRGVAASGVPGVEPVPGRLNVQRIDDAARAQREAEMLSDRFGHELLYWPAERVRAVLDSRRYYQALHDVDAFSVHPFNLAHALAAEIEASGGRIFEATAALAADLDGVRKRIETSGGRVRAHEVVFAGSAFLGRGFPALARTVLPVSTYVCVTEPISDRLAVAIRYPGAIMDTRRAGDYYRVVGDRLLWGGRITTATRAPRRLARLLARDMARVYPALAGVAVEYAWPGIMGYAVHKMPQIGMVRPGVWIASAFGGHGLNNTAIAGELIASAMVERDDRWRLFIPFGLVWAGGWAGRRTTQFVYWGMQTCDAMDETRSRLAERTAPQRAMLAEMWRRGFAAVHAVVRRVVTIGSAWASAIASGLNSRQRAMAGALAERRRAWAAAIRKHMAERAARKQAEREKAEREKAEREKAEREREQERMKAEAEQAKIGAETAAVEQASVGETDVNKKSASKQRGKRKSGKAKKAESEA